MHAGTGLWDAYTEALAPEAGEGHYVVIRSVPPGWGDAASIICRLGPFESRAIADAMLASAVHFGARCWQPESLLAAIA